MEVLSFIYEFSLLAVNKARELDTEFEAVYKIENFILRAIIQEIKQILKIKQRKMKNTNCY